MTGIRNAGHKQFAAIPSATGGIARLAYARAKDAGIALPQLLADSGLTVAQIEDRHAPLKVKAQITFLGLVADALGDDLLGFHLAQSFDLREIGLLYYVMASSEVLEDALRRVERYSGIVNEGISLRVHIGKHVTIRFNYVGVERYSDRQQIEFWLTTIIRICRQLTSRRLIPSRIRILHRQRGERPQLEAFFGCKVEFSASADEIVLPDSTGHLFISSADPYLNELLIDYCEEALSRRKASHLEARSGECHCAAPTSRKGAHGRNFSQAWHESTHARSQACSGRTHLRRHSGRVEA